MNYKMTAYLLGEIALIVAALMCIPFILALAYAETKTPAAFAIAIGILVVFGGLCVIKKPENQEIGPRVGFVITALSWIMISAVGALPFTIAGAIPSYIDSLFETVSGFTTTGSSILSNVEIIPKSLLFWRSFTHWIGGMGVLVFVIAILPKNDPNIVHLLKAEVPGPQFGKLVSKLRFSARILYAIYIVLTLVEAVFLLCGGMSVFEAFIHAFGTAGTGGFSTRGLSIAAFDSVYIDIVITVFMLIFSVNFNLFYLIIIGHVSEAFRSEELRCMFILYGVATAAITISLTVNSVYNSIGEALRYATFQTAAIISTTGYATADIVKWPLLCQLILVLLMFVGGSAGSTAGGLKVSRVIILIKSFIRDIRRSYSPRSVQKIKLDKKPLDETLVRTVTSYYLMFMAIYCISILLLTFVGSYKGENNLIIAVTGVTTCINNVGPGLSDIGPMGNFSNFSIFSKVVLIFDMLIGRLEVLPMVLLFSPKMWKK